MNRNDLKAIIESENDVSDKITMILNRHHAEMNELKSSNAKESETLNTELEDRIKALDERERLMNERECKQAYDKDIQDLLSESSFTADDDLKNNLKSYINFSDKDSYEKSFKKLSDTLVRMKPEHRQAYEPNKGSVVRTDPIAEAFAPPKVY